MPIRLSFSGINTPTAQSIATLASTFPLARADNSVIPRESQDGEVHPDASAGDPRYKSRSGRPVTPTKRSSQHRATVQRSQATVARRAKAKAIDAAGQDAGKRKGKAKRPASGAISTTDIEDEDGDDSDSDEELPSLIDPISDACELLEELAGETYRDELGDPSFCRNLTAQINELLKDEEKREQFSRETLQEALRIVRRTPSAPHGDSRQVSSGDKRHQLRGDSEHHGDHEPQPGDKRRSDAPQVGPPKRGRFGLSKTPSTVAEGSPPLFGTPLPGGLPGAAAPPGLPPTASRGRVEMPKGLPRSKAVYIDRSPSPLPAAFRALLDDTQTVPEDTQTVPEDTQPVPEAARTVPAGHSPGPGRTSSSPDLGAPPPATHRSPPLPAASSSRKSGSKVPPKDYTSEASLALAQQFDEMAAKFDRNERLRAMAYSIRMGREGSGSKGSSTNANHLPEEDAAEKSDARAAAEGKPAKRKRKRKAGLNCQSGLPRQAASRAVTDMSAYLFATGPYVPSGILLVVAMEAYERAFQVEFPEAPIEDPLPELIEAIADRAAIARTNAKLNLRSIMTAEGGYGFKGDPETEAQVNANVQLYRSLRDDFHYGDLNNPQSHYEHPALKVAFVQAFFPEVHSPCAIYHNYFKPAVSPQSVAVMLSLLESCICEWSTGRLKKENLNSKIQGVMYEKHMHNLRIFAKAASGRFQRMRESFYAAGCRTAVLDVVVDSDNKIQPTIRFEEIRPDTPPPSSSDEDATPEDANADPA